MWYVNPNPIWNMYQIYECIMLCIFLCKTLHTIYVNYYASIFSKFSILNPCHVCHYNTISLHFLLLLLLCCEKLIFHTGIIILYYRTSTPEIDIIHYVYK
jgi:hypothetical protein